MKQTVIYEASEILDTFDLEEISKLLQVQLSSEDSYYSIAKKTDHFKPLYYKYQCIVTTEANTEDIKNEATDRFMNICNIFLSMICKKYQLSLDTEWKDDHYNDLPGLVMGLYSFFVLNLASNIYDVCLNYIKSNLKYIYDTFEERKNKKDSITLVNKKNMPIDLAIVASNVYDITTWILSQLSEEQFIEYINPEYLPLALIKSLFEEGYLSGDFMSEINDIYASDITLKSETCFNIITVIETGQINGGQ